MAKQGGLILIASQWGAFACLCMPNSVNFFATGVPDDRFQFQVQDARKKQLRVIEAVDVSLC